MKRPVLKMVQMTFLGALCFVLQMVMAPLPNIEPVSLLVMLYAVCFGWPALTAVYVFVFLEFLFYGVHFWSLSYLYVWTILFVFARALKNQQSVFPFALLSGLFGLSFGGLCALIVWLFSGFQAALSWWLAGLSFDAIHCLGNLFMTLLLFKPLRKAFDLLKAKRM